MLHRKKQSASIPDTASHPVILVAGPTASGKSAAALAIAEAVGGAVVNADSMQVYRDLALLSARPTPAEMGDVPHYLYGILDASERCSAGRWLELATRAIDRIHGDGSVPVVAGGTGLYLMALTGGIAPVPDIPDRVRAIANTSGGMLLMSLLRAMTSERRVDSIAAMSSSENSSSLVYQKRSPSRSRVNCSARVVAISSPTAAPST